MAAWHWSKATNLANSEWWLYGVHECLLPADNGIIFTAEEKYIFN